MPRFSAFTPCGVLRLSAKPSPGKLLYEQIKQLYGSAQDAGQPPFDLTKPTVTNNVLVQAGTHLEAKIYASARSLARATMLLERAGDQGNPIKAYDLIPLLEQDLHLSPGPFDCVNTRQNALAAAQAPIAPNMYASMVSGLQAILGTSLLAITVAPHGATRQATPVIGASQGKGHYADARVPTKFLKLVDPVVSVGTTSYVGYTNLDSTTSSLTLSVGDLVTVQAENSTRVEVVQVTGSFFTPPPATSATLQTAPAGTPTWASGASYAVGQLVSPATPNGLWFECVSAGITGSSEPTWPSQFGQQVTDGTVTWLSVGASTTFSAVFQSAHDIGASVLSGNVPLESSTQRFLYVVVTVAAATNRDTRRQIDTFMGRMSRAVSQWAIIAGTSTGPGTYTAGPFNAGTPLGGTPIDTYP